MNKYVNLFSTYQTEALADNKWIISFFANVSIDNEEVGRGGQVVGPNSCWV